MFVDDISVIGRNTSGVKLMNIDQDSDIKVASIAKVRESATRDNEAEEEIWKKQKLILLKQRKMIQKNNVLGYFQDAYLRARGQRVLL